MRYQKLPPQLRAKLRICYDLYYPEKRAFDEASILGEISQPLQQEVALHKFTKLLDTLGIRDRHNFGCAGQLCLKLTRRVYLDGDYLTQEGRETDGMYFIAVGKVEVLRLKRDESGRLVLHAGVFQEVLLATLGENALVGEMSLLEQHGLAMASVRVSVYCEAYQLSKPSFNTLTERFPELKGYIQDVAESRGWKKNKGKVT